MAAVTFYCLELCCLNYPQNLLHTIINLNHVTHSGDDVTWFIVTSWWRHSHLYMWRFYCKFLQSKRLHFSSPCINHSYIYMTHTGESLPMTHWFWEYCHPMASPVFSNHVTQFISTRVQKTEREFLLKPALYQTVCDVINRNCESSVLWLITIATIATYPYWCQTASQLLLKNKRGATHK